MNVIRRTIEEIRLESELPSEIHDRATELREKGFVFQPTKNFMNEDNQTVYYTVGQKYMH